MGAGLTESRAAVRAQLTKILDSKPFRTAELPTKFLAFVVTKTLEHRAGEIKEYSIGVEAFGRGPDFDPRIDSVVRVVARRVRDKLAEYYRDEGKSDLVVIVIQTGSYVPSFTIHESSESAPSEPPVSPQQDSSGITPGFETMSDASGTLIEMERNLNPTQSATISGHMSVRDFIASKWGWISALALLLVICAVYFVARPASLPRIRGYKQLTHDGEGKLGAFAAGTPAALVTDGSRVYFNEVSGSQVIIKEVSTSGGDEISLATALKVPLVAVDISPDRSQLLATNFFQPAPEQQLFTLTLPDGKSHPLANIAGHGGAWSPDGTQICYLQGNRMFVADADGTGAMLVAEFPGMPSWPRWSLDGTRLRLTVQDASGGTSIWEASLRGLPAHPLLPGWNEHPAECCGSWNPDGSYFVFQSEREGRTSLWAMPEPRWWHFGASNPVPFRMTEAPLNFWGPVFSPDGHKVFAVAQQQRGELVRYDAASHQFVLFLNGISADHVEFSRDSEWVVYSTYPEQTIWRSRPDGSDRLQLTFAPMAGIFSRWSPDGRRIAFMGSLPGKPVGIYTISSDGGDPEPLIPGDHSLEIDPNWSPDGASIMFARLTAKTSVDDSDSVIQILDLRTKRLTTLSGSTGLTAPRWSPDGTHVVATALSHGRWKRPAVMIYDFTSQKWEPFEDDPIDNKWWSNDGKYFYFDKTMDQDPAVYRLRLSDHAIERIVSLKEIRRSLHMMGLWMGLTPTGEPMVLRDTSIEEIYALDWDVR